MPAYTDRRTDIIQAINLTKKKINNSVKASKKFTYRFLCRMRTLGYAWLQ